jgi:hypothetical protein
MFAWSQLDFSAFPVSISAVNAEFKMYRKGKDIRKKRHLAAFVFFPSLFWGEISNS